MSSQPGQHPLNPDGSPDSMRSLLERVAMINRIQSALRATLSVEDIYSIVLSTMISRSTFNFSRVLLLAWDESRNTLRGQAALGAGDRDEHDRLQAEIVEEENALANMVRDLGTLEQNGQEETIFKRSLRDLSSHSFWITTFQKFSNANVLQDALRLIEFPFHPYDAKIGPPLVHRIVESESALVVKADELQAAGLPAPLVELLSAESLWCSVHTQKGLRLVIIADKVYQSGPIEPIDALHVDWFAGQVALGLENAEMYQDLDGAYRSLRELDHMKSNFLATISHELRTPLTAINGYLQLVLGNRVGVVSPGQREVLERVMCHAEHLTGKVNDLIEIAELDMEQEIELDLETVDPLGVAIGVLQRVEARRAQKSIAIEPVVDHRIPAIRSNTMSLERILFHLIDNAVKFCRAHGHVRIEFEEQDDDLRISIVDDGIGINEDQLQRIFDAFYQVDNQLTRSYEGLGIGLAIIKRQLEQTGGRIEVQSRPEQGSRFTIIYPLSKT